MKEIATILWYYHRPAITTEAARSRSMDWKTRWRAFTQKVQSALPTLAAFFGIATIILVSLYAFLLQLAEYGW
jgi:hypothetical protein